MNKSGYQDAAEKTKALARRENNKRRRILVVDDDQISLALLKQLLEVHGYEILETPKGLEAIDIARNEQPDLILMDIRLPDICGLEVTRLLKQDEQSKAIPIIAVTALATPEYEKKGLENGCDAYIAKPIALDHLLRTIESFFTFVPSAIGRLHIDRSPTSNDRYPVATSLEGSAHDAQRGIK
jgi:two-component system cell cycle response regulator DivK